MLFVFYQIFSWIVDKQYFELLPVFRLSENYVKFYVCFSQLYKLYKLYKLLINYRLLIYCEIYNRLFVFLFIFSSVCCSLKIIHCFNALAISQSITVLNMSLWKFSSL